MIESVLSQCRTVSALVLHYICCCLFSLLPYIVITGDELIQQYFEAGYTNSEIIHFLQHQHAMTLR